MENPPPTPPPTPPKKGSGDSGNEPQGFNWKVLILFMIALAVLIFAVTSKSGFGRENISFNDFEEFFKAQKIVTEPSEANQRLVLEFDEMGRPLVVRGMLIGSKDSNSLQSVRNLQPQNTSEELIAVTIFPDNISDTFREEAISQARIVEVESLDSMNEATLSSAKNVTPAEFKKAVVKGRVQLDQSASSVLTLYRDKEGRAVLVATMVDYSYPPVGDGPNDSRLIPFEAKVPQFKSIDSLKALLDPEATNETRRNFIGPFFIYGLPIILILLIFLFFRSQMKNAGRGAMNFGKSKARLLSMDKNKVTFKDVAGVQEAKEEVTEIVDFLKDPRKFQALGGSIPKGVLMVGSPGTGKTLLARAIAGEADVPFFSISGSDFVEMFVGVGASRVRDMFEQGKKHAPCLIFIDEIDAVGRHRGHGVGGGHDEREQTLNALLVEMDGFDTQEGVIIIAATNRPDVLDPALLRPGRFDRQVTVSLPDVEGRKQILGVHAKKIKLEEGVNLETIARGTPGFSGAELANLINEAALLAARKDLKSVTLAELEEARDKVRWGRERRSMALSETEKKVTAYHEAGHALLLILMENTNPLHKVTIIPRGPYLGAAFHLPSEDKYHFYKRQGLEELVVTMGGRVAEELVFGDVTSGASGDIRQATNLARKMVCEWGMSDDLGMVEYGNNREEVFLARDMANERNYSEATAVKIDEEIRRLVDEAYAEAKRILTERFDALEGIAKGLLEFETLSGEQIRDIVEHGEMKNPPQPPSAPILPEDPPKKKTDKVIEGEEREDDDDLPGEIVGAPA